MPGTVVIIPLYNHGSTVIEVLDGVLARGYFAIVVDDGSSDDGAVRVGSRISAPGTRGRLVRLERNLGKAAALQRGIEEARLLGARIAITVDADGQHDVSRLGEFERAADMVKNGPWMVLGDRRPIPQTYPLARLVGRMLSGLAVRAACGREVGDAACGMRAYLVESAIALRCTSGRYAWEEEAIVRAAWAGCRTLEVQIPVIYRDPADATSHYRFIRDWSEGTAVLVWTVALRLFDPRMRWAPDGAGFRELAWPLCAGGRFTPLLSAFAAAIAAMATSLASLVQFGVPTTIVVVAALLVMSVRTRAPLSATLIGAIAGLVAPTAALPLALPMAFLVSVAIIRRMRNAQLRETPNISSPRAP